MRIIEQNNIVVRFATPDDVATLCKWWNDGSIMEHAGFPHGLGTTEEHELKKIQSQTHLNPRCIIEIDGKPVGELNYRVHENGFCYPGWKICDTRYQNQGYGTQIIQALFKYLFEAFPIHTICWDTTLENERAQHVYSYKFYAEEIRRVPNAWVDQLGNSRTAVEYALTRAQFESQ